MKIGVTYPMIIPITTETAGSALVYGTAVVNMKAMAVNLGWTRNDIKLYANDTLGERDNSIAGGTVGFDADNVTDEFKTAALAALAADSPATYHSYTDDITTACGFGWIEKHLVSGVKKFVTKWLYKVAFALAEDNITGRQETREGQGTTIEGAIYGVEIDSTGKAHFMREETHTTYAAAKAWLDAFKTAVATPTATPGAGAVADETEVTLATTTSDATIYYTTDGSTPTTGSMEYSTPLVVGSAMTIKAIAVKDGMANSAVLSAAYTIAP